MEISLIVLECIPSTVSRNFHKILDVMVACTSKLIVWPNRGVLRMTMPISFRTFFSKCAVISDCSEVFMERPSDLLARAQVWSNYKHHSTIKYRGWSGVVDRERE